ncbi:MAG: transposase family protein, partial [bacterium]|nr:transposase family protein [bacterium]
MKPFHAHFTQHHSFSFHARPLREAADHIFAARTPHSLSMDATDPREAPMDVDDVAATVVDVRDVQDDDFIDLIFMSVAAAVAADEGHRARSATARYHAGWVPLTHFARIVRDLTVPLAPLRSDAAAPASVFHVFALMRSDPDGFARLFTLTPQQFMDLLRDTKPFIEGARRDGGMAPRLSARGRPPRATATERLAAALIRLRTRGAAPQTPLLPYAGSSTPNADFWHVMGAIEAAYDSVIRWPNRDRRRRLAAIPCALEGCIGFVDATEIPLLLPTDAGARSAHFSGKQGTVTISIQLICDIFGNIIDVEGPFPGSMNDIQVWRASKVGSAAGTRSDREYFDEDQFVLGDCGYAGCGRVLMPYESAPMDGDSAAPRARRIFSNVIRRYRAVVEYVFGLMKGRWAMVAGPMTCRRTNVMLAVKAAAVLVQLRLRESPLRMRAWYRRDELLLTDWEGALFRDEPVDTEPTLPMRLTRIIDEHNPDRRFHDDDDDATRAEKVEMQFVH